MKRFCSLGFGMASNGRYLTQPLIIDFAVQVLLTSLFAADGPPLPQVSSKSHVSRCGQPCVSPVFDNGTVPSGCLNCHILKLVVYAVIYLSLPIV